jgi:hypothetical protein
LRSLWAQHYVDTPFLSGRLDSNQRLLAPKASALAGLSYAPMYSNEVFN